MTVPNPGFVANVPPLPNKVSSDWGNAIRDRVVQHFGTEADRDTAITAPIEGQVCYVDADHALLVYAGATDLWQPPWNLPWGHIGSVEPSNFSTASTSLVDVTSATVTFTALANRKYRVSIQSGAISSTAAADVAEMAIVDGSGTLVVARGLCATASSSGISVEWVKSYTAGSQTLKAQARRAGGSGTVTFADLLIVVEDIGPSGAPA